MIRLTKGRPTAAPIVLAPGAVVFVRPATAFEVDLAIAGASKLLIGLVDAEQAADTASAVLGEEFRNADFTSRQWIESASQRVALLELATKCIERWEGIGDADGNAIEKPDKSVIALLLRNAEYAARISAAINANVHQEGTEGNGSPASRTGGAAAGDRTAPDAGQAAPNAPKAA